MLISGSDVKIETCMKIGPRREKPCLRGFAYNKDADQPARISALIIRFLEIIISELATGEMSIF